MQYQREIESKSMHIEQLKVTTTSRESLLTS